MGRSRSFASSALVKGGFASAPHGAGRARCSPGCSPGYQELQKQQIRAIHTGSFLSTFARLITSGREAVTSVGSNLFPKESCPPCACVYPHRCGSQLLETRSLLLVFGAQNSIPSRSPRLIRLQQSSPGSQFWARSGGSVAQQQPCPSRVPLRPCRGGTCWASLAAADDGLHPRFLPAAWQPVGKGVGPQKQDGLGEETRRGTRAAQFDSRPSRFRAASRNAGHSPNSLGRVARERAHPGCAASVQRGAAGACCERSRRRCWRKPLLSHGRAAGPTCCAWLSPLTQRQR